MDEAWAAPLQYSAVQWEALLDRQGNQKVLAVDNVARMNSKQAKGIPISAFLEIIGLYPATHTESGDWYHSPLALNGDHKPSFQVSKDGHMFHDWSSGTAGTIVDLAMALLQTNSVSQALDCIARLAGRIETFPTSSLPAGSASDKRPQISRIEINDTFPIHSPALLNYITKRHIPVTVAMQYCTEINYRIAGQKRPTPFYAIGFPNDSGGFELRNAYVKLGAAPKDITTIGNKTNGNASVFEGFFDFLSAITLGIIDTQKSFSIILNSTSLYKRAIEKLSWASSISCYLDNDDAGKKVTQVILGAFPYIAHDASSLYKHHKDLNDFIRQNNE